MNYIPGKFCSTILCNSGKLFIHIIPPCNAVHIPKRRCVLRQAVYLSGLYAAQNGDQAAGIPERSDGLRVHNTIEVTAANEHDISVIFRIHNTYHVFPSFYQNVKLMAIVFSGFLVRLSFSCCTAMNISSEIMASWEPV